MLFFEMLFLMCVVALTSVWYDFTCRMEQEIEATGRPGIFCFIYCVSPNLIRVKIVE